MRLTSRHAVFTLLAFGMACHKPASAAQGRPAYYILESIDAKPLPASWPAGDVTMTTHWGKLWLYADGRATTQEYQTYSSHGDPPGGGKSGSISTAYSQYRIHGDSIKLAFHPCKAPCFLGYVGKVSDSTVTLTAEVTPQRYWPVYLYRRSASFAPPPEQDPGLRRNRN